MSQSCTEINVKRLGEQQKMVLRYLYENREKLYQQTEIIEHLYGDVTDSRKASMTRSITLLREADPVSARQAVCVGELDRWIKHRVRCGISEEGEKSSSNGTNGSRTSSHRVVSHDRQPAD